jgi:surface protein
MGYMFQYCSNLTSLDVSNWNTSKVTNMNNMFHNCKTLTTVTGELDLSGLTNGFYPGSTTHPVKGCTALETLYLKNIYKNCTMTNASKWCINLGETKVKDECLLYIINELPDLKNDKGLTATSNIVLTLPKKNTLTAEQVQVAIDKGWSVANTTY